MVASTLVMCTRASARAAAGSLRPWAEMASRATAFQAPAANEPLRFSQYCAMRICSGVRRSEIARISARSAWNFGDPTAGGAGARKSEPVVMKKGRIAPSLGPSGGAAGRAWLTHLSGPAGAGPDHASATRSLFAASLTAAAAARPVSTPAAKSARPSSPTAADSRARRAVMACSSLGKRKTRTVAAAPAAAPAGLRPWPCAVTMALLMARFMYASVREAGNWPTALRAIRSHAYSFQLIVEVGSAQGLGAGAAPGAAIPRGASWAQLTVSAKARRRHSGRRERRRFHAVDMVTLPCGRRDE